MNDAVSQAQRAAPHFKAKPTHGEAVVKRFGERDNTMDGHDSTKKP